MKDVISIVHLICCIGSIVICILMLRLYLRVRRERINYEKSVDELIEARRKALREGNKEELNRLMKIKF